MTVRLAMPFHLPPPPQTIMHPWSSPQPQPPPPAVSHSPSQQRPPGYSITEIIPRLYISDLSTAESPAVLSAFGITHVLSAMPGFVALPPTLPITHTQIPLDDFPFSELAAHLPTSTQFLRDALTDPRARVLVHCVEGVSRSVSVVSAFLIATRGMSPKQAVQFVKARRKVADPNSGFVAQLHEYAEWIQVASPTPPPPPPSLSIRNRLLGG